MLEDLQCMLTALRLNVNMSFIVNILRGVGNYDYFGRVETISRQSGGRDSFP